MAPPTTTADIKELGRNIMASITTADSNNGNVEPTEKKKPAWFSSDTSRIPEVAKKVLVDYSGIPEEDVQDHVLRVRDAAWAVCPYPCIGQLRFLECKFAELPSYPTAHHKIVDEGGTFLDVGCCVGQEVRMFAAAGVPASHLFGCDVEQPFLDLGFDLFRDKERLSEQFVRLDLSEVEEGYRSQAVVTEWKGKMDVLYLGAVLHIWDWETQVLVLCRVVEFASLKQGTVITGRTLGNLRGGAYPMPGSKNPEKQLHFLHDETTFKKIFEEVGRRTNTEWTVTAGLIDGQGDQPPSWTKGIPDVDPGLRMTWFSATLRVRT